MIRRGPSDPPPLAFDRSIRETAALADINFQYRVVGGTENGKQKYWLQVYKRYNFGTEEEGRADVDLDVKGVAIFHIDQPEWARLHTLGLAHDYDAVGSRFYLE